jgi:hypothetical protein
VKTDAWFKGLILIALLLCLLLLAQDIGAAQPPKPLDQIASGESLFPSQAVVVTQPTASISGTVRHNGNPVSGVSVSVSWASGSDTQTTGVDGVYAVSGVPTGGWVAINVRPPSNLGLTTPNWSSDDLPGDQIKDFDLVSGSRFTGQILAPDGMPYLGLGPEFIPIDLTLPSGEYYGGFLDQDGSFDATLPPVHFALIETPEMQPYSMPHTVIDLSGGDVLDAAFTLQRRPSTLPAAPPVAGLIQVSAPDADGNATVSGVADAVGARSAVVVVNLNAHTLKTTASDDSGAFSLEIFAPPGSSLLVKYDPRGDQVSSVWSRAKTPNQPGDGALNSLPGTIVFVGPSQPGDSSRQSFRSAGAFFEEPAAPTALTTAHAEKLAASTGTLAQAGSWAGWWMSGTLDVPPPPPGVFDTADWNGLALAPGQPITVAVQIHITSPELNCSEPLSYSPALQLNLMGEYGADGWAEYWGTWFTSYLFTPTGLPMERESFGHRVSLGGKDFSNLSCVTTNTLSADLVFSSVIPLDLAEGTYVPHGLLDAGGIPLSEYPLIPIWYDYMPGAMPPLRVGDPALPRIPWTILGDYPVNGYRGVIAREDSGQFAMPTRVVHPPQQVIIPRLDERSGEALVYRLEPGSNWLSSADRRQGNPLHIPLQFPSGELIAEVIKPDGGVDQLGPAPIAQSSVRTPTTPGGALLNEGTGHICDIFRLTTLDDAFAYTFDQYGHHVIQLYGFVQDIYGNSYSIEGTYDVFVARVLDLDPAQLPTTPFKQGDAFAAGLHIFPPVPADVVVELVHMPYSDPQQAVVRTIPGKANRFGYFQPQTSTDMRMEAPGEFRVDISAQYEDPDGTLWMGAMTWGGVVEGATTLIEAHGKRGMDAPTNRQPWFQVDNLAPESTGVHVYYPYFSGDIHWGAEDKPPGDSIQAIVTIKDTTPTGSIYDLIRYFGTKPYGGFEGDLEEQMDLGEAPLFTTSKTNRDPGVFPEDVELWAYWYGSSQRPDVRVREVISIGGMPTAYWRFNDTYGYQIGEPADGDQAFDMKWEFGSAVFRVISETNPINEYAIYSSFWVRLPLGCDAYGCARVTPPFQEETGASINGGPIMTLLGEEIDMLFLPKGVRPGDVLETGDIVSFSGHVGPPLDSRVAVTITTPSGVAHNTTLRANKIGWIYDPDFDFPAEEPGRWTVDVAVVHDRPYTGNGVTPLSHNTGTVLGTQGQYAFYVVPLDSQELYLATPEQGYITWPTSGIEPVAIRGRAPFGTANVYYTIHDKGVVMAQGTLTPTADGAFVIQYDAKGLNKDFPMVSLTAREGRWEGLADEVTINLLAIGPNEQRAANVTLIGEEIFVKSGDRAGQAVYLPLMVLR